MDYTMGNWLYADQHKTGMEQTWYYIEQFTQYRGFFTPSIRNRKDRNWLRLMRGKEYYIWFRHLLEKDLDFILTRADGSINGADELVNIALEDLEKQTYYRHHPLGEHRSMGVFPGSVYFRDVSDVYELDVETVRDFILKD